MIAVEQGECLLELIVLHLVVLAVEVSGHQREELLKLEAAIPVRVVELNEALNLLLSGADPQGQHHLLHLVELKRPILVLVEGLENFLELAHLRFTQIACHYSS